MEYQSDLNGSLFSNKHLKHRNLLLEFAASNIRHERTGVHAKIEIRGANKTLAYSTFNLDRDEERVRLANSAYEILAQGWGEKVERGRAIPEYPKAALKFDLDEFSYGLGDAWLGHRTSKSLVGPAERRRPDFLIEPFVLEGGGTILFAPPGRGKSYMLMTLQVCLDAGLDTFWKVSQVPTLLVNLERSERSVAARLANINEALGLPRGRQLEVLTARGASLLDLAPTIARVIHDKHIGCTFVDSISRAGSGDLTENQTGNRIIDTLNGCAETWVALAHTPRDDETHLYGTVHFEAGADVVVQMLTAQAETLLNLGLRITKANDVRLGDAGYVGYRFDDLGLRAIFESTEPEDDRVLDRILRALQDAPRNTGQLALQCGVSTGAVRAVCGRNAMLIQRIGGDDIGGRGNTAVWALRLRQDPF